MSDSAPSGKPAPAVGALPPAIGSHRDFVAALQGTVQSALAQRCRRMLWVDRDFAQWPLDDSALLDALTHWLRLPQRRLLLLAESFEDLARCCPRFVAWCRLWSHALAAFSPPPGDAAGLPCLLIVEGTAVVQLLDRERWRGRISLDSSDERRWREAVDALLQRSDPAFPATTLGL